MPLYFKDAKMNINVEKDTLRKDMFSIRKYAKQKNSMADEAILDIFQTSPFFHQINFSTPYHVAGYLPINSELSPLILLQELISRGATALMPAVLGAGQALEFRPWDDHTPLCNESYGTKAPIRPEGYKDIIPNIIFVPLLAFDKKLYRLGYGGGFYDRTIKKMQTAVTIGLAYDEQYIDIVPTDSYDMPLRAVITPTKMIMAD